MSVDIAKLNRRVEQFCSSPSSLVLEEAQALLKELLKAFCYEEDFLRRKKLEQLLGMIRRSAETDISTYAHILHSIAFEECETGDIDFAEYLFRNACDLVDDNTLNNNLAYVLRRKRGDSINNAEVITLLLPGVKEQEPFCMINMGLLFALNLSAPNDWKTADALFSLLPDRLSGADSWWENLGSKDEVEGYLVHFFLLRHEKIEQSSLGSIKSIVTLLTKSIDGFPEWLTKDYAIETIDDEINGLGDPVDYSVYDDLDNYVVINFTCNDDDEEGRRLEIPFCGGTLICRIESEGTITLLDFCGDTRILFIPTSITINGNRYNVNPEIPDMAFESCMNVEYIVIDYCRDISFGSCVFYNCSRLSSIIQLSFFGEGLGNMRAHVSDIWMDEYSFCAIDEPSIEVIHIGYPDDYFCDGWLEHRSWFECDVEAYTDDEREKRYNCFRKEELQAIRHFRWIAELSGRIEQLIVHYSTNDEMAAFCRLLRRASSYNPLSDFFAWNGLTKSVRGPDSRNYVTDIDDELLYADICRMKPLKSEQYHGNWQMCC